MPGHPPTIIRGLNSILEDVIRLYPDILAKIVFNPTLWDYSTCYPKWPEEIADSIR
mgnify:CR=1 FL=1